MRAALASLIVALLAGAAAAAPSLTLIDSYRWQAKGVNFGGFSGLWIADGGRELIAVSDRGKIFEATVVRHNPNRRIERIRVARQTRPLHSQGKPVRAFTSDIEALAVAPDGTLYLGFESYARIQAYDTPMSRPRPLHDWDRFWSLNGNHGFEALAARPEGGLIAILEAPFAGDSGYSTFVSLPRAPNGDPWEIADWAPGPHLRAPGGYSAVDAEFGPDGKLYVLERRFALLGGFTTRIRRFGYDRGQIGAAETLLKSAPGELGNMEGMSIWRREDGQTIVTLISDDNFLAFQKTLVVEYRLTE